MFWMKLLPLTGFLAEGLNVDTVLAVSSYFSTFCSELALNILGFY